MDGHVAILMAFPRLDSKQDVARLLDALCATHVWAKARLGKTELVVAAPAPIVARVASFADTLPRALDVARPPVLVLHSLPLESVPPHSVPRQHQWNSHAVTHRREYLGDLARAASPDALALWLDAYDVELCPIPATLHAACDFDDAVFAVWDALQAARAARADAEADAAAARAAARAALEAELLNYADDDGGVDGGDGSDALDAVQRRVLRREATRAAVRLRLATRLVRLRRGDAGAETATMDALLDLLRHAATAGMAGRTDRHVCAAAGRVCDLHTPANGITNGT